MPISACSSDLCSSDRILRPRQTAPLPPKTARGRSPMRDVLILLLAFSVVPLTFLRPHVGILAWCWISYMNPHRLSWGFAYEFHVAMMIGLSTLAAWVLSKEPKQLRPEGGGVGKGGVRTGNIWWWAV